MNGELDPNIVAAEFLKQNMDEFLDLARGTLKGAADKIRLHLHRTYSAYLKNLSEKYSKTKSFLLRGEPVPLYRFYVPLHLQHGHKLVKTPSLRDVLHIADHVVLTGSGGCGKSMFVRHLLCNSLLTKDRVPIFVELRQFNSFEGSLTDLIQQILESLNFTLGQGYIQSALAKGHFVVFLDGFDEVLHNKRQYVTREIQGFSKRYSKNSVIITSRPDQEVDGWQQFTVLKVAPLAIEQAHELVEKLPYDQSLKVKFLRDLKGLFKTHESFLSNPLLLSIMLLTYGQSAAIPSKLNVFYNQAFEALFERHDALKDGYRRTLLSPLDIQEFSRLFSAFCIQAYDVRKIEFSHTEALDYIERAQKIVGVQCKKDDYLADLIQAVCILIQDGIHITYSHRSFQEYFAARFIAEARPDIQRQLIEKYSRFASLDSVFGMLYELRPEVVEQYFILPGLETLLAKMHCKKSVETRHYIRFVNMFFREYEFGSGAWFVKGDADTSVLELIVFALRRCGRLIGWNKMDDGDGCKGIGKKYKAVENADTINLMTSPNAKRFLCELARADGFLSIKTLEALVSLREALLEKARAEERSLANILKPAQ